MAQVKKGTQEEKDEEELMRLDEEFGGDTLLPGATLPGGKKKKRIRHRKKKRNAAVFDNNNSMGEPSGTPEGKTLEDEMEGAEEVEHPGDQVQDYSGNIKLELEAKSNKDGAVQQEKPSPSEDSTVKVIYHCDEPVLNPVSSSILQNDNLTGTPIKSLASPLVKVPNPSVRSIESGTEGVRFTPEDLHQKLSKKLEAIISIKEQTQESVELKDKEVKSQVGEIYPKPEFPTPQISKKLKNAAKFNVENLPDLPIEQSDEPQPGPSAPSWNQADDNGNYLLPEPEELKKEEAAAELPQYPSFVNLPEKKSPVSESVYKEEEFSYKKPTECPKIDPEEAEEEEERVHSRNVDFEEIDLESTEDGHPHKYVSIIKEEPLKRTPEETGLSDKGKKKKSGLRRLFSCFKSSGGKEDEVVGEDKENTEKSKDKKSHSKKEQPRACCMES